MNNPPGRTAGRSRARLNICQPTSPPSVTASNAAHAALSWVAVAAGLQSAAGLRLRQDVLPGELDGDLRRQ
eukprot:3121189-Rhodomonas_salina.1